MPTLPTTNVDAADVAERLRPFLQRAGAETEVALARAQSALQAGLEEGREVALRHGLDPTDAADRVRALLRPGTTSRGPTTLQLVLLSVALSLLATAGAVALASYIRRREAGRRARMAATSGRPPGRGTLHAAATAAPAAGDLDTGDTAEDAGAVTAA